MSYTLLGTRGPVTGKADASGHNPGNWTVAFPPEIMVASVSQIEIYKMIVSGAANTTFNVFVDNRLWDVGIYGTLNSWDPVQPLIMRPGETLYFCYSDATTDNTPPVVTIWLRYDPETNKMGNRLCHGKTYSLHSSKRGTR
jgi:hypothetical protein